MAMERIALSVEEPWLRQEGESAQAFEAFAIYRNAEPKTSAAKVAEKLGKSTALVERWCAKNRWLERRDAFLDYQDRKATEELVKGIGKMRKNHAELAIAMQLKVAKALKDMPIAEMTPADIARMFEVATKVERLSRGEATERTEGKTELAGSLTVNQVDLANLTDDDLRALDELTGKIASG